MLKRFKTPLTAFLSPLLVLSLRDPQHFRVEPGNNHGTWERIETATWSAWYAKGHYQIFCAEWYTILIGLFLWMVFIGSGIYYSYDIPVSLWTPVIFVLAGLINILSLFKGFFIGSFFITLFHELVGLSNKVRDSINI